MNVTESKACNRIKGHYFIYHFPECGANAHTNIASMCALTSERKFIYIFHAGSEQTVDARQCVCHFRTSAAECFCPYIELAAHIPHSGSILFSCRKSVMNLHFYLSLLCATFAVDKNSLWQQRSERVSETRTTSPRITCLPISYSPNKRDFAGNFLLSSKSKWSQIYF